MSNKGWLAGAALAAALAGLVWLWKDGVAPAAPGPAPQSAANAGGARFFGPVDGTLGLAMPPERAARLQALAEYVELVDRTYCSYREGSKYPPESRPIADNADQVYPNAPVTETHPIRSEGGRSDPAVRIQTSQSRVFMAAGESVAFSLRAVSDEGRPLALVVTRAVAQGMTFNGARPTQQVVLGFTDDGRGADPVAGDGAFAGVLAPAHTGFSTFNGTIRSEVRFSVDGRTGVVLFDVIYSPELPATWSGQVREASEDGSLHFYLKADVRTAGRYVVTGRVDDARGKPFALATFNDVLGTGPNEVRLTVFGKLMRDQEAALPLTLRDVDGYLLKENTDPDRALMPRLEGKVYLGKPQQLRNFSDAEWQGEERSRYLTELGKDVNEARAALAEFDPARPLPASACAPPP